MPTLFQDRLAVSLYDAQWSTGVKTPIPAPVIARVVAALARFKRTCDDFGVPPREGGVRVIATEATREAINSAELRGEIQRATGWEVEMLDKREEGRVGALGVVSSLPRLEEGLVVDMGGGSIQLTWVDKPAAGGTAVVGRSASLPYGAAALLREFQYAQCKGREEMQELRNDVSAKLVGAMASLGAPAILNRSGPARLYLSGGGFRGWGYLLMDAHPVQPYPIPIINGFRASISAFAGDLHGRVAQASGPDADIFRVSERRSTQVPAVAFLVDVLREIAPRVEEVVFCQGGVREGALFERLDPAVKSLRPLRAATAEHAPPSGERLCELLRAAVPRGRSAARVASSMLRPLVDMLYVHRSLPRDTRAAGALRSTTSGVLAATHGLLHEERALLALALCERWGGESETPATDHDFLRRLREILVEDEVWWARYLGAVARLIGDAYPAGVVREGSRRLEVVGRDGGDRMLLDVRFSGRHARAAAEDAAKAVKAIEKVGKRKNWVGGPGREGWGIKVEVSVAVDESASSTIRA